MVTGLFVAAYASNARAPLPKDVGWIWREYERAGRFKVLVQSKHDAKCIADFMPARLRQLLGSGYRVENDGAI